MSLTAKAEVALPSSGGVPPASRRRRAGRRRSRDAAMQLHSPAAGKRLWNYLRVAFFMARKGFAPKRKLLMLDISLLMKRGKLLGKSLGGLVFHHPHRPPPFGHAREYEFSCSNSPAAGYPVFYHGGSRRRRHNYFPCLHAVVEEAAFDDAPAAPVALPRIEYSPRFDDRHHLAPGEPRTPPLAASPFSVPIANFSSDDDDVDGAAEEFIERFYEQLRAQSRVALLQYQEMEYQAMLARGA